MVEKVEFLKEGRIRVEEFELGGEKHYRVTYSREDNSIGIYTTINEKEQEKAKNDFLKKLLSDSYVLGSSLEQIFKAHSSS